MKVKVLRLWNAEIICVWETCENIENLIIANIFFTTNQSFTISYLFKTISVEKINRCK